MILIKGSVFVISLFMFCLGIESWIIRLACKYEADFTTVVNDFKLTNNLIGGITTNDQQGCIIECIRNNRCKSVNYQQTKTAGTQNCELNGDIKENAEESFEQKAGWVYMATNYNTTKIGSVCEFLNPCGDKYCADACNHHGYKCFQCNETKNILPVEPFCKTDILKNLALNMPSEGSSYLPTRPPSLGNDGRKMYAYPWCFTSVYSQNPWWRVELKSPTVVQKISIWTIHTTIINADLRTGMSGDGAGLSNELCAKSVMVHIKKRNDFTCMVITSSKYVSVIAKQKMNLRLCELEVQGHPA